MSEKDILNIITSETKYRIVYYKILNLCTTPIPSKNLVEKINTFPELQNSVMDSAQLIKSLEEVGAIEKYSGEDQEFIWKITEAGQSVHKREAPDLRVLDLFMQEPEYIKFYKEILDFCLYPRQRQEIEKKIKPITEKKGVIYPQYFIANLESVGALEWVDHKWQTTSIGQKVFETQ